MTTIPDAGLDLADPDFLNDPYPALARLRERAPLVWHEQTGQWLATTYAVSNGLLRDRRFGRIWHDRQPTGGEQFCPQDPANPLDAFNALHRNQMMETEPPDHTRLRSLVAKAFARGHVERLRPRVQAIADGLLDAAGAGAGGSFDLIEDFAEPLPVAVIAELLGVPEADRHLLRPWSASIVAMYEYDRTSAVETAAVSAAAGFTAYVRELAEERRRRPQDDLVSDLAAAEGGGSRLSNDELVASAVLLLNAGHEASVNAFGNGVVALLAHPDQLALLYSWLGGSDADGTSDVVGTAIEEMLRFDAPLQLFERTAGQDVEVGGVAVPAGGKVAALLGAANHDPAVFADPTRFDMTRTTNPHIGFGAGVHHCLGAPLARMELQVSLPALLRRCPGLGLTDAPVRRPTFVLRGYSSVPVRG